MRKWQFGMTAVLWIMIVVPGRAQVQTECLTCDDEYYLVGEISLAALIAEIDQLVSFPGPGPSGTRGSFASKLDARVSLLEALVVDHGRGTLRLSDCTGHLITEWKLPEKLTKHLSGTN